MRPRPGTKRSFAPSPSAGRWALGRILGLHDCFRLHSDEAGHYNWWDYRAAGFRCNVGLRIDPVLVSDALYAGCAETGIDRDPRRRERPSDHAPAWAVVAPEG